MSRNVIGPVAALAFGAGLTLGTARPATAEALTDAFLQICAPAKNDPTLALARADASGWAPLPNAAVAQALMAAQAPGATVDGRVKQGATGRLSLIVMNLPTASVRIETCEVLGPSADIAALKASVAGIAAVPETPQTAHPNLTMFLYLDAPGGHKPVGGQLTPEALKSGQITTLSVGPQNGGYLIGGTTMKSAGR